MRKLLLVSLFLSAALATYAGGEGEAVIKIGVAGPHTGDLAPYGLATLTESQRLAEVINAEGGLNGKTIEILPADDVCDPAQAANLASKLVDEGVIAVIGHVCSGATESALPTYVNATIPVVSPSATNPSLTKSGKYPVFFRTIAPDDAQGITQAEFLVGLGIKIAAVIHDKQDYGKGLADSAKGALESNGVSIPVYEGVTVGAGDYSAVVAKILSSNAEAVVFGGYHPEGSKLITQLKDKGYGGAFISGDGLYGPDFVNLAGEASEGVYTSGPQDISGTNEYKSAIAAYKAKYNEDPGAFFNEGHSAFQVIQQAIQSLGDDQVTAQAVLDKIRTGKFSTLVGNISFDDKGDARGVGFNVYQVTGGKFKLVK